MKRIEAIKELQEKKSENKKKGPGGAPKRWPGAKKFNRQAVVC